MAPRFLRFAEPDTYPQGHWLIDGRVARYKRTYRHEGIDVYTFDEDGHPRVHVANHQRLPQAGLVGTGPNPGHLAETYRNVTRRRQPVPDGCRIHWTDRLEMVNRGQKSSQTEEK